jgi:hypothetical protein
MEIKTFPEGKLNIQIVYFSRVSELVNLKLLFLLNQVELTHAVYD